MSTTRLVALLLTVAALVVFAVQNTSPALPLVFLGMQTKALPIAAWLVGAIAAGAITTLLLAGLMDLSGGRRSRSNPGAPDRGSSWTQPQGDRPSPSRDYTAQVSDNRPAAAAAPEPKTPKTNSRDRAAQETDWQTFRSPETWNDWGEQPDASAPPPRQPPRSRRQREQYQVEDSLNELTEGWQDWQDEPATASDAVDPDALASDWEDWTEADAAPSEQRGPVERDYEVQSPPKRAYQSGSIYSYSYRGEAERANVADTPADEIPDEMDNAEAESGGRVAADGVYEADYRVIVPPYRNLDETDG